MSLEQRKIYFKVKESRFIYNSKNYVKKKLITYYTNNISKQLYNLFQMSDIDTKKEMKVYKAITK